MNKFWFLTRESLKKKVCTKSFKIVNIVLCLVIVLILNLDNIIKSFGGDFNNAVNIYVVDEVNLYNDLENTFNSSYLDILESYDASIKKSDKTIDELKKTIKENETNDVIIDIKNDNDNIFKIDLISYDYIDQLLYQNIISALNNVKVNAAIKRSSISEYELNKIYSDVSVNRVLLNEELNEDSEFIEEMGGVISIIFVFPFFILIVLIVQMIGAEINEEKRTKSMEVIISSVSAKTHFLSKLTSANIFAITQGALLIVYVIIGFVIRVLSGGMPDVSSVVSSTSVDTGTVANYVKLFMESELLSRLIVGIPLFIIIILLSFFAYSLFIGVLASVTTNMEDYNQIQTPVMLFLLAGYYLAIYASVFQGASFIKVAAFIPFISGILAPVMYSLGQMSVIELIISIFILAGSCYLLFKYGLKIYKEGILNYQSSNLWKKLFNSLKH